MWTWLSMQRRAGPRSSLGPQGGAGSCHHAGEARGSGRETRAESMLPFSELREEGDTSGGRGGDERGPGDGAGKVLVCPHPPFPLFPRLQQILPVPTELPASSLFLASILPSTGLREQLSSPPPCPAHPGSRVRRPRRLAVLRTWTHPPNGSICRKSCHLQPSSGR